MPPIGEIKDLTGIKIGSVILNKIWIKGWYWLYLNHDSNTLIIISIAKISNERLIKKII